MNACAAIRKVRRNEGKMSEENQPEFMEEVLNIINAEIARRNQFQQSPQATEQNSSWHAQSAMDSASSKEN